MLKPRQWYAVALALIASFGALIASAQILNSERIEQTFGSYGIDVLYSDDSLRLSNLYSTHDGKKITRTIAFVEYPEFVNDDYTAEHQTILSGGSIGSTFAAAGWEVIKQNLSIIEIPAPNVFAIPMGIENRATLATHFYQLSIAKNERQYAYAAIAELHHPDYLRLADLESIYPLEEAPLREDLLNVAPRKEEWLRRHLRLLTDGLRKFRESGLSLSQ